MVGADFIRYLCKGNIDDGEVKGTFQNENVERHIVVPLDKGKETSA